LLYDTTLHYIETLKNGNIITMHIFKENTGNKNYAHGQKLIRLEKHKFAADVKNLEQQVKNMSDKLCLMDTFFENCPVHLGNALLRYL
jgi:hypothetical protein